MKPLRQRCQPQQRRQRSKNRAIEPPWSDSVARAGHQWVWAQWRVTAESPRGFWGWGCSRPIRRRRARRGCREGWPISSARALCLRFRWLVCIRGSLLRRGRFDGAVAPAPLARAGKRTGRVASGGQEWREQDEGQANRPWRAAEQQVVGRQRRGRGIKHGFRGASQPRADPRPRRPSWRARPRRWLRLWLRRDRCPPAVSLRLARQRGERPPRCLSARRCKRP